jgi:D-3-phosphoglycerate dehydrogenase
MAYRILTLNQISARGLERLPRDLYEIGAQLSDPHGVLVRSADMHAVPLPASVLAVARAGAGTNNIPVAALSKRGAFRCSTRRAPTPMRSRNWSWQAYCSRPGICARHGILHGTSRAMMRPSIAAVEQGKKQFVGFELPGKTLGVIGLGAVGVEVANSALALGDAGAGLRPADHRAARLAALECGRAGPSLEDLFARADLISVHVPLSDGTRGLVNAARLKLMRRAVVRS